MAVPISRAQDLLGLDFVGPDEVSKALGLAPDSLPASMRQIAASVPFSETDLQAARQHGQMLILRLGQDATGPLTIQRFIERFPSAFDPGFLTKVGYALRDEWGITLEPLAKTETCATGWYLTAKAPLPESCNLSYYEQEEPLATHAAGRAGMRRRTAIEATFDLVVYNVARGDRLLCDAFDWTSSRTVDGGYLYVGGFGEKGLSLVGFSAAVRHASLGLCPTRGAA